MKVDTQRSADWIPPVVVASITEDTTDAIRQVLLPFTVGNESPTEMIANGQIWQLAQLDTAAPAGPVGTLGLIRPDNVELSVSFTSGKARHRLHESGHGAQPLKKALGLRPALKMQKAPAGHTDDNNIHILDATGGLGRDAWAIASLGCQVSVFESNAVIHALLLNGLQRAALETPFDEIAARIQLIHADACDALEQWPSDPHNDQPAVHNTAQHGNALQAIFLDPMYPASGKSSAVRKGMQFLQALLGPPDPEHVERLLLAALGCGAPRVVVKRPRGAPRLYGSEHWRGQFTQSQHPNTRYDIYHQPAPGSQHTAGTDY